MFVFDSSFLFDLMNIFVFGLCQIKPTTLSFSVHIN